MARLFLVPLLVLGLAGCASVGIRSSGEAGAEGGKKPAVLYIVPFTFERCALNVDREGAELDRFEKELARSLAYDVATRVIPLDLPPQVTEKAPAAPPRPAWLLKGRFTLVNQGSRAMRSLVGFGGGGTKMETQVEVYDLSLPGGLAKPLFSFATSGGSGASPGAVVSSNPYSFAASAAIGSAAGIGDDRKRTARMIVATLSEELAARGWLAWDRVEKVKRLDAEDAARVEGDDAPNPDIPEEGTTAQRPSAKKGALRSK